MSIAQFRSPRIDEELVAEHERHNTFDRYAIAATKLLPATIRPFVVGNLSWEISRFAHYLILHGAQVLCNITDSHH